MRRPLQASRGATLVELLVGMLVGLIVLGIALQLTLLARTRYQRIADQALIEDRGTQALDLLTAAVQQAGWVTDIPASSRLRRSPGIDAPPSLQGQDNCKARNATANGIVCTSGGGIEYSDALVVRFAGKSKQPDGMLGDGSVIDCSGYAVPENGPGTPNDSRAGIMLLYITESTTDKEPQLMCLSWGRNSGQLTSSLSNRSSMVRGIETMQILYTVGSQDGTPTQILSARSVTPDQWRRVQAVHIALVVRGNYDDPNAVGKPVPTLALFPHLRQAQGTSEDLHFTPSQPLRRRAVFTATVRVRNPLACEVDVC